MDHSARAAALVRFNELGEEEIDRRAVLHLEKFKEKEGREMADQEFNDFVRDYRRGFVTLNPMGEVAIRQTA